MYDIAPHLSWRTGGVCKRGYGREGCAFIGAGRGMYGNISAPDISTYQISSKWLKTLKKYLRFNFDICKIY
jgi:hypothetical protein